MRWLCPRPLGTRCTDEPAGTSDVSFPPNGGAGSCGSGDRDPPNQPNDMRQQEQQEMDLDPEKGQKR